MTNEDLYAILELHLRDLRRRNLSKSTFDARTLRIRQITEAVGAVPSLEATETWLDELELVPATRANYVVHIKAFYRWAIQEGHLGSEAAPLLKLVTPIVPKGLPHPIRDEWLEVAISRAPKRMKAWLLLAAFGGLRAREIAGLQGEDIMFDEKKLRVSSPKGGHERIVPLHPEVWGALIAYGLPRHGPVFTFNDRQVTANYVSSLISRYLRSLRIDASAHSLRHWYATRLLASTHDLRIVAATLGHRNINTTTVYADWDREAAQAGVWSLGIPKTSKTAPKRNYKTREVSTLPQ